MDPHARRLIRPSKIVCVGRNYAKHAAELGNEVPSEPLIFLKPPSALVGPGDPIVIPRDAGRVDFEGEIGVVIGSPGRRIAADDAWNHVAGLVALNDVTARDLQRQDDQWTRAKGFDSFCPVGELRPLAEVDPSALVVRARVNGTLRQEGRVEDMVFPIPELLAWISRIMTLEAGDLVATGTPDGIGPLEPGDDVEVEVVGVGVVRNPVVSED